MEGSLEYVKGIGPKKAEILKKELEIHRPEDLIQYYPFRYEDRSKVLKINSLEAGNFAQQFMGKIISINSVGNRYSKRLEVVARDDSDSIKLLWFNIKPWIEDKLKIGKVYVFYGVPKVYNKTLSVTHPEITEIKDFQPEKLGFQPVYSLTEKARKGRIDQKVLQSGIRTLLTDNKWKIDNLIPDDLGYKLFNINRFDALKGIHFPKNLKEAEHAIQYLKFEELLLLQIRIIQAKRKRKLASKGFVFGKVGKLFEQFYSDVLPFPLTNAQKRVIKEMHADMKSGHQMNRVLQGDVGSGKTIVALLHSLIAIDNGTQVALMAPTEILAFQHFENIKNQLSILSIQTALLTGSTPAATKKETLNQLVDGKIQLIIGTHALIEDHVKFEKLGLVIIDEQHRFGVAQRARLWHKSVVQPHVLVMTATPIPRTLNMTIYGDLDHSVIDELPKGRIPIKTAHRTEAQRLSVWGGLKKEIAKGRQVYIVYPLIEESKTLDYKNLMDGFEDLLHIFPRPDYTLDLLHGRMKKDEKEIVMDRFRLGKTQILVSTTVIEVGVDVPNATVMVIESAEKFGLAQLHQLRGRVGRSDLQSYCILMTTDELSYTAKKRIKTMCKTNDGHEIAQVDLELRGPGDIEGTQQSGMEKFKIANLTEDEKILTTAKSFAQQIIDKDPELTHPKLANIKSYLQRQSKFKDWSRVS